MAARREGKNQELRTRWKKKIFEKRKKEEEEVEKENQRLQVVEHKSEAGH